MTGSDIRIFSDQELKIRNKGLQEVKSVLNNIDVDCILILGALLGAVREKNFIKWDWDVELAVFSESIYKKFDKLEEKATEHGFTLDKVNINDSYFKVHLEKYNNKYTLLGFDLIKDMRVSKMLKIPSKYFETLGTIKFLGEIYKTPNNIEEYLVYTYGEDWRTPKKTHDKNVYFNNKVLVKSSLIKRIIYKLKNLFSN